MPDILHRVGMQGPAAKVYEALSTTEGLSHWWITGTTGDPRVGGMVKFQPDGGGFHMKVLEAKPDEMVRWECVEGPAEWVGTKLTFRLVAKGNETYVLFTHADWRERGEFMYHCSTKWALFLMSLKSWVEHREGHPHPYDVKIHPGD
ncbi:MAG TPA: SRPBCC domain-containing protein [Polyangia bacterium]|nr:SRPBCC domain-containing protein [Polyangia bacterium]